MHQQVLLSRGRVAVWRLQALIVCVKVCHGDTASVPHPYSLKQGMQGQQERWGVKEGWHDAEERNENKCEILGNNTITLALNTVYKTCFMSFSIWGNVIAFALNGLDLFSPKLYIYKWDEFFVWQLFKSLNPVVCPLNSENKHRIWRMKRNIKLNPNNNVHTQVYILHTNLVYY